MDQVVENIEYLLQQAKNAAIRAGVYIANNSIHSIEIKRKQAGSSFASQIFTEIDLASERLIYTELEASINRFEIGWLAEEGGDNGSRFKKDYFWSIDPLDGTLPFINGEPGYSVSIALVSKSGESILGVVFDPVTSTLYYTSQGFGTYLNGQKIKPIISIDDVFHLYIDRSFEESNYYTVFLSELTKALPSIDCNSLDIHIGAGAVMNGCMALERGKSCYFKFPKLSNGGGSLWDFAAISVLFKEAGCSVSDIYGNPLDLNRQDSLFMNHNGVLFCSNYEIASVIKDIYQRISNTLPKL